MTYELHLWGFCSTQGYSKIPRDEVPSPPGRSSNLTTKFNFGGGPRAPPPRTLGSGDRRVHFVVLRCGLATWWYGNDVCLPEFQPAFSNCLGCFEYILADFDIYRLLYTPFSIDFHMSFRSKLNHRNVFEIPLKSAKIDRMCRLRPFGVQESTQTSNLSFSSHIYPPYVHKGIFWVVQELKKR